MDNNNNESLDGALTCECKRAYVRRWVGGAVAATLKGSTVFLSVGVDIWTRLLIPQSCAVFSRLQCKCARMCTERTCLRVCVRGLKGGWVELPGLQGQPPTETLSRSQAGG